MKRQMKIAAVVSATALLAIGASFTSMAAAKKGEWIPENGTWYAYDKNGKMITDEFVLSNGLEFYVGEDGAMVTEEWVEHEGSMYYINKDGLRTTNIWRELTPYEDPEADEEWYWFDAAGKRAENKSVEISDETFYFDHEGRVLYGWVDDVDFEGAEGDEKLENLVYTNERGALVTSTWVETLKYGEEEGDEKWFYLGSNGNPVAGKKKDHNDNTYFFGKDGVMLENWIVVDEKGVCSNIEGEISEANGDVYYTVEDDGHMKSNQWVYAEENNGDNEYWFWIKKNGKVFLPEEADLKANGRCWNATFVDGFADKKYSGKEIEGGVAFEKINNEYYAFNVNGEMQSGLMRVDSEDARELYYFGEANDGAMKTGLQKLEDAECNEFNFFFGTQNSDGYEKGVGVTGAANGYLYNDGVLVKAEDDKYAVVEIFEDVFFIVDRNGKIQKSHKLYEDDGVAIVCTTKSCYNTAPEFSKDPGVLNGALINEDKEEVFLHIGEPHADAKHNK